MGDAGVTARVAQFVRDTDVSRMGDSATRATERLILDTLACAIGALGTEPGRLVADFKREQGGTPEATLVGSRVKLPAAAAAYVHAQLGNVLDADETYNWTHSACASVLATLAVAEKVGATGAELLAAAAVAFEVGARIAFSMPVYRIDEAGHLGRRGAVGFSWAAYGAAAGAGKLLGLDADRLAQAFGITHVSMPGHGAATLFTGYQQPWHKSAMYAEIAEAGVNAALLAQRGFVADPHLFDEGSEFYQAMLADSYDHACVVDGLGEVWGVERTALKPWPFCRYGHGQLDQFARIVEEHDLKPDEIESVSIGVPPYRFIEMIATSVDVPDKFKIMTSLPYAMAMVAHRVPAGPKWWHGDVFGDPGVHAFAQRVHGAADESLNERFLADLKAGGQLSSSGTPGWLRVRARGEVFEATVGRAIGDPTDPAAAWSDADVAAKVVEYADGILAPGAGEAIAKAGFELRTARDLSDLMTPCGEAA